MQPKLELVYDANQPILRPPLPPRSVSVSARAARLAAADLEIDRLEMKVTERLPSGIFQSARVLLVGFSSVHLADIRSKLRVLNVAATAAAMDVRQLQDALDMGRGFTHIFVNLDAFEDVASGVDALMSCRPNVPDRIIVACSEMVGGDDFGSERSMICDATLKLPISTPRLANGLLTAQMNHSAARKTVCEFGRRT